MKAYLLRYQLTPNEPWQELAIQQRATIGRNPDNTLVLDRAKVSRQHAEVFIEGDLFYIKDLESSNGTVVGGQKISAMQPVKLVNGSVFSIGDVQFQLLVKGEDAPLSAKETPQSILWYRIEKGPWQQVPFYDKVVIGRGEDCDLSLDESHVSRNHCQILAANGTYFLKDLGSHNGTLIEGKPVIPLTDIPLFPGQYFSIGRVSMTIAGAAQQKAFERTKDELRQNASVQAAPQLAAASQPVQQKKSSLPILLGIGAIFTFCMCITVLGLLYVFRDKGNEPLIEARVTPSLEDDDPVEEPQTEDEELTEPTATNAIVDTPAPTTKWLVMLYQNADDEVLEPDIVFDVNTAEMVGSTDSVKIVAQLDRYSGAYAGDGNWSESRRYELLPDGNIDQIGSPIITNMGEVDSGQAQTLVDFAIWAINTYPAEHYILIMSDHGAGMFGGFSDMDNGNDEGIRLPALESALSYITTRTGIGKLDIIGFDACLMAQLEVWSTVAPYAQIGVGSEEVESATGWAYEAFLKRLVDKPEMTAEELAAAIVDTFVSEDIYYQLMGEDPSYTMEYSTLSAIDLRQLPTVQAAADNLAVALQYINQSVVAEARNYSMAYVLVPDYTAFYLDIVNFGEMACGYSGDGGVCGASETLSQAVNSAIFAERHGAYMQGSNGLTFYFPDSIFFEITMDDSYGLAYRQHAAAFTNQSIWDEFLDFHYLGVSMP